LVISVAITVPLDAESPFLALTEAMTPSKGART